MGKKAVLAGCCTLIGAIIFAVAWTSPKRQPSGDPILEEYDRVLNDLGMIQKGEFGPTRIPRNPYDRHMGFRPTGDPAKDQFLRVVQAKAKSGFAIEHGFIPVWSRSDVMGGYPFWHSVTPGDTLFGEAIRNDREQYIQVARKIGQALDKDPSKEFETTIGQWRIVAKAVPYRHKECTSCHKGAKVGDVAGNVAVAYKPIKK